MAGLATPVDAGQVPVYTFKDGLRGYMLGGRFVLAIEGGAPDGDPPAGDPPAADPPASGGGGAGGGETFDKDRALATIGKLRGFEKLSKEQAKELDDLRAKVKAAEDAQLSETERLKKQAEEATAKAEQAEARARERTIRSEVKVQASELGFADADDAWHFIDQKAIELGDDGEPTNVKKLLEDLLKAKPYLAKPEEGTGGKNGVPPTPKSKEKSADQIIATTKDELWATGRYSL